ncbi:tetratricopeptide repeat protein [Planctomycetota bacterium]
MDNSKQLSVISIICAVLLGTAITGTIVRGRVWKSNESLSLDILEKKNSTPHMREKAVCILAIEVFKDKGAQEALDFLRSPEAESSPKNGEYNYVMAKLHFINKNVQKSEEFLAKIKHDSRLLGRAHYIKGMIALQSGDEEKALKQFHRSLAYDKHYWYSRYRIARIHRTRGDIENAVIALSEVVEVMHGNLAVNKEFGKLLYALAKKRKKQGEASAAKEILLNSVIILKRIVEKGNADRELMLLYIDILIASEHLEQTKQYIDRAYKNNPDDPEILSRYIRYCRKFLQYKKAEELCEKLNMLTGGENLNVLFLLGEICYQRRRFQKAEDIFQRCLEKSRELGFDKKEIVALNNLALIAMYVGDYESAFRKYNDIIEKDKTFWQAHAGLAEIHIRRDEFVRAEQAISTLKSLIPHTYFTLVKLESLLKQEKQREQYRIRYRDQKSHS